MKALLITFAVLLLLLTLLSTFGGSIRSEPFYQPALEQDEPQEYYYNTPMSSTGLMPPSHISEQYTPAAYVGEHISEQYTPATQYAGISEQYTPAAYVGESEISEQYAAAPTTTGLPKINMQLTPPATAAQKLQEGFSIEPFEKDDTAYMAF
jgi:hypothetical protein